MATVTGDSLFTSVLNAIDWTKTLLNWMCDGLEPWQILVYSTGSTLIAVYLKDFLFQDDETLTARIKRQFFYLVKKIPQVKQKIATDMAKTTSAFEKEMLKSMKGDYICKLPVKGLSDDQLMEELEKYKSMSNNSWKKGMVSGTVYNGDDRLTEIMTKTYRMFAWTNPLHPDVFPDVRKMEAEVVRMCCTLFNGDHDTCGTVSSGGTESILLAMLAYRNIARERGVKVPEIIAPVTAHAAFDKAASYLRMKITHIPVDEKTRMVDLLAMRRAISKRTCALVASAPQFPHGIIDPVEEIAKLGLKYGISVHVDCCLGGFLLPFMEKAGFPLQPFDFRVPGVTSISADTHKYGFAPKGSSVIMYRNTELRSRQFFVTPDWPGGLYGSPTFSGSRAGSIVAACWATLMHFGEEGYVETTKKIVSTTRYIVNRLKSVPEIFIFGEPQVSVIGVGSHVFNVYRLLDALVEKGWNLNSLQFPSSFHICVTLLHTQNGIADKFITDVQECVKEIMKDPKASCRGAGAIYGFSQGVPDRSLVYEAAISFIDACYSTKGPASGYDALGVANGDTPSA